MVHAINSDADEEGGFVRLAEDLADQGIRSLRFSFRAHGASDGAGEALTVAGEQLDLLSAMRCIEGWSASRLGIVASSFGAVPLLLSLDLLRPRPDALVLWNPVLDVPGTFVSPSLPWGIRNFSPQSRERARDRGWLDIDGEFRVGSVFLNELERAPDLSQALLDASLPTLIIHGDRDTYVSYAVSERVATVSTAVQLHTIHGSEHGFPEPEQEREARRHTTAHLVSSFGRSGAEPQP